VSGLGSQALVDKLVSVALITGRFDRVNAHEPKAPPGSGLSAAVWVQHVRPVAAASGLSSTSAVFMAMLRIYSNMLQEPQDAIDPGVCDAADDLMSRFSGGFTLGGLVREVDLLGEFGQPLAAQAGYITIQQTMFRCMDITLPLIVNDVWTQGA
jgi:hypothetical protein